MKAIACMLMSVVLVWAVAGCAPPTHQAVVTVTQTTTASATPEPAAQAGAAGTGGPAAGAKPLPEPWSDEATYDNGGVVLEVTGMGTMRPTIDAVYELDKDRSLVDAGHYLVFKVQVANYMDEKLFVSGLVDGESAGIPIVQVWDENLGLDGALAKYLGPGLSAEWVFAVQVRDVSDVQLEITPFRGYPAAPFEFSYPGT